MLQWTRTSARRCIGPSHKVARSPGSCIEGERGSRHKCTLLTDRQTNRQTDRQTNRQTDKQTNRQTDKQTVGQTNRHTQTHTHTHAHTDTQTRTRVHMFSGRSGAVSDATLVIVERLLRAGCNGNSADLNGTTGAALVTSAKRRVVCVLLRCVVTRAGVQMFKCSNVRVCM